MPAMTAPEYRAFAALQDTIDNTICAFPGSPSLPHIEDAKRQFILLNDLLNAYHWQEALLLVEAMTIFYSVSLHTNPPAGDSLFSAASALIVHMLEQVNHHLKTWHSQQPGHSAALLLERGQHPGHTDSSSFPDMRTGCFFVVLKALLHAEVALHRPQRQVTRPIPSAPTVPDGESTDRRS